MGWTELNHDVMIKHTQ